MKTVSNMFSIFSKRKMQLPFRLCRARTHLYQKPLSNHTTSSRVRLCRQRWDTTTHSTNRCPKDTITRAPTCLLSLPTLCPRLTARTVCITKTLCVCVVATSGFFKVWRRHVPITFQGFRLLFHLPVIKKRYETQCRGPRQATKMVV